MERLSKTEKDVELKYKNSSTVAAKTTFIQKRRDIFVQYHDFSDFNERYLQSDSAYDIIPNIEKGVAATGLKPGMCFGQWYILATARYHRMIFAI